MIYFDNGATTYPKPRCVVNGVASTIRYKGGNPSRSSHRLSLLAGEEVYKTREAVAELLNASFAENVVFTYNATYALNMAIKTLINEKCHVIISDIEHNSVRRPLNVLKNKIEIDIDEYDSSLPLEEAVEIFSKHQDYADTDEMKRGAYLREYNALSYFMQLK